MAFKFFNQLNIRDCGVSCIKMIAYSYGKSYSPDYLRKLSGYNKTGTTMFALSRLAEKIGLRPRGVRLAIDSLQQIDSPCIIHWKQNHFVVLLKVNKSREYKVADPAVGIISYNRHEFIDGWCVDDRRQGHVLLLEPSPKFYEDKEDVDEKAGVNWQFFLQYLRHCKPQAAALLCAFLFGLAMQLVTPFLMKSFIDIGIEGRNFGFIKLVIIAQLVLIISSTIVNFVRTRVALRLSNILNLSILSDFWIKVTKLPISYFDKFHTGDIIKRLGDHSIIQNFMTNTAISVFSSVINFAIYSIVLVLFNPQLFVVFMGGNLIYFLWIKAFMPVRRKLNYQSFELGAKNQTTTIQLIEGMQDIKLNNAEHTKRWFWEDVQTKVFRFGFKTMDINQFQSAGGLLISQIKDITLSLIVAKLVIDGNITLGTMVSVQYIIGQLSGPISTFISLIQSTQDAKISLERLNDIHKIKDEEDSEMAQVSHLPEDADQIQIRSLSYAYAGSDELVLKNIDLDIPIGKTTAIVGTSGGGKSTLMKILMKSYTDYSGDIHYGDLDLKNVSHSFWRSISGFVVHEGFIFNDTIERNIALSEEFPDEASLDKCCQIAKIQDFVRSLPNGYKTIIGTEGVGVSQGQKQRFLIARALYKAPKMLFLDEATNSLDTNTESKIIEDLQAYTKSKTVIVIAHRLSTIKNADQIVVMENGEIQETGTHTSLISKRGTYYQLVEKQIETLIL
ncbi:ABC transporter ATP-binding protein [Pedobacter yulinensis]|uniref:ABC transporter ATP-binding protein n=1 Tax=Pedobacter yulinensis TaxID=2126353 RepID=A0A2T3HN69_9SPHI|nr:peptidase domain-containing ABC transporter [Pedobacter yulinensis]PST83900.1 ABC transporter ATP-binding protein [Pedobacter yulinensis]